jgi:hypothetical protein
MARLSGPTNDWSQSQEVELFVLGLGSFGDLLVEVLSTDTTERRGSTKGVGAKGDGDGEVGPSA